jgi:hypothetical protein
MGNQEEVPITSYPPLISIVIVPVVLSRYLPNGRKVFH